MCPISPHQLSRQFSSAVEAAGIDTVGKITLTRCAIPLRRTSWKLASISNEIYFKIIEAFNQQRGLLVRPEPKCSVWTTSIKSAGS